MAKMTLYCLDSKTRKHLLAAREWKDTVARHKRGSDYNRVVEATTQMQAAYDKAIVSSLEAAHNLANNLQVFEIEDQAILV